MNRINTPSLATFVLKSELVEIRKTQLQVIQELPRSVLSGLILPLHKNFHRRPITSFDYLLIQHRQGVQIKPSFAR